MKKAIGLVAIVTGITCGPLIAGRIPFPAHVVTRAPPWRDVVKQGPVLRHGG